MNSDIEREAHKSREGRKDPIKVVLAIAIITVVLVSGFLVYTTLVPSPPNSQTPKAAIVDQLSIKYPNETFIQTTTSILANAGFAVTYYDSSKVTVEFWRTLPADGYSLIVLRVHSITHNPEVANYTGFFTVEPWDSMKYAYEQATDQILGAAFSPYHEGDPVYFAITSQFVTLSMAGRLDNTTIVMMGCNSLTYTDMAGALVEKGARVCIGWNASVLTTQTDCATTQLLENLIIENLTIGQATEKTNEEANTQYNGTLLYYPSDAEGYIVPTPKGSNSTQLPGKEPQQNSTLLCYLSEAESYVIPTPKVVTLYVSFLRRRSFYTVSRFNAKLDWHQSV